MVCARHLCSIEGHNRDKEQNDDEDDGKKS
jgi:hypothetical protein